jgi:hypothetical protein
MSGRVDIRPKIVNLLSLTAVLAQNAFVDSEVIQFSGFERVGLDWDLPATPNIKVEILQSNVQAGPFAKWSDPDLSGLNVTNDVTVTTQRDGTNLILSLSGFGRVRVTNLSVTALAITAKARMVLS